MKLEDLTASNVADLPTDEIVSLHHRTHQLWNRMRSPEQRQLLTDAHRWLVEQMEARGIKHTSPLGKKAPGYYESMMVLRRDGVVQMGALIERVPMGRVLDLGAGIGTAARVLANSGREVVCLDQSREAVLRCGELGLEAVQDDALEYLARQDDDSFDCVYSLHFLEHHEAPDAVLEECARVAKQCTLHVVPLGERGDESHKQKWKSMVDFSAAIRSVPYAKSYKSLVDETLLVEVHKDLPDFMERLGDATVVKNFVSVVGGTATRYDPMSDLDVLIRQSSRDEALELVVRNQLTQEAQDKLHFIYHASGPHGDSVPLYDLVLRPADRLALERVDKAFAPITRFQPAKPGPSFLIVDKDADDVKALLGAWAGKPLGKDREIAVERKYNGWRGVVQFDGKRGSVFFEGNKRERIQQFPDLLADLKAIGEPMILDVDFGAVGTDGKPLPRIALSQFASFNKKFGLKFDTPAGPATLKVTGFDVPYFKEDLSGKPYHERRAILKKVLTSSDLRVLAPSEGRVVKNPDAFVAAVKTMAARPGSEGVVVKKVNASYPAGGSTSDWMKAKNAAGLNMEVMRVKKAGDAYSHTVGLKAEGGDLVEVGGTMNHGTRFAPGAVVKVDVEELIPLWSAKQNRWEASIVVGIIRDRTEAKSADSMGTAIKKAEGANVLQAGPPMRKLLREAKLVKQREEADDDEGGSGAEGNLDFKVGDSGSGVLQLHEMGLSEEEAKEGKSGTWSAHTDFRLRRGDDDYWEGGEFFTPGNNHKKSKLLQDGARILMNFKVPKKEGRSGKGPFVVHGPLGWLKVGAQGPKLLSPGTPGAYPETWSRITKLASIKWKAGTQDEHYKEFMFEFDGDLKGRSGRWVFAFAPLGDSRKWIAFRPAEQRMDAERKKGELVEF